LSLKIVPIENLFIEHLQWKREAQLFIPSIGLYKSTLHTTTHAHKEAT
jgi:hypothetical protein